MSKRRGQNEGTIFEEKPGRWVALLTLGHEVKDGKRRRIRKKFTGSSRQDVQRRLTAALNTQQRGGVIRTDRTTVAGFLAEWLESTVKPSVRPKTLRSYEQMVRNHLVKSMDPAKWKDLGLDNVPGLGGLPLQKLGITNVTRFFAEKLKAKNSPSLVRYLRTVLRVALNDAMRRELIDKNVAAIARPPQGSARKFTPLTGDETKRLFGALVGHRLEALFTTAFAVGLRHGEALALKWEDSVDLNAGELRVFHTLQRIDGKLQRVEPKSDESRRIVPLPEICVESLQRHRERQEQERQFAGDEWHETGYVFTSRIGTPLIDRNVLREFYKLMDAAKMPRRRFHDLRHACVSLLAEQGVPDKTIAEIVGHSDVRLTKNVYQHASAEGKRTAVSKMGNYLSGLPVSPVAPSVAPSARSKQVN
jgi:integrase